MDTRSTDTWLDDAPMREDSLNSIFQEHKRQEEICRKLEQIADDLPHAVQAGLVNEVLAYLRRDLPAHVRDEEEGLFPLLEKRALAEDNYGQIRQQLKHEHETDECYAHELAEALEALIRGEMPMGPNALGHMLRACFESHRRHLAWENAVVLPLARKRLTPDDLAELDEFMLQNHEQADLAAAKSMP